jgi:DNA-binding winged helix-turn-helix (wHTH) protein
MPEHNPNTTGYRFGVYEVDLRAGEVRKSGVRIKLQEQPFQVLVLLLRCSPSVVSREELRKSLWDEDTFVEFDHGLSNAVSRIREALSDSVDNARFIETLPKRGYRFIAPMESLGEAPPRPALADEATIEHTSEEHSLAPPGSPARGRCVPASGGRCVRCMELEILFSNEFGAGFPRGNFAAAGPSSRRSGDWLRLDPVA